MATSSDTQRAAIRERRRLAHVALRERHQRQEVTQAAAFSALGRLARQLDAAAVQLGDEAGDPLERAASIAAIAGTLGPAIDDIRAAAAELAATAALSQAEVAELLGTRSTLLFPRARATAVRSAPVAATPTPEGSDDGENGAADQVVGTR